MWVRKEGNRRRWEYGPFSFVFFVGYSQYQDDRPQVRLVESPLWFGEVGRNDMQQQMFVGQEEGTQQPIKGSLF